MLRAAVTLFIIGLVAMLFGMYNVAGVSMELGRILLFLFVGLAVVGFVISLVSDRQPRPSL